MTGQRFHAQEKTIQKALHHVMTAMEVETYKVIQEDGYRIIVMFVRKGLDGRNREYRYISDYFDRLLDNYRGAQLAISRIWDIFNEWHIRTEDGESSLETLLQGFRVLESKQVLLALPDPKNRKPHELLGVSPDATSEEIEKAFRAKAKTNHPDVGGDNDTMQLLNKAKKEMLEALR
jgi:hypothetical protein